MAEVEIELVGGPRDGEIRQAPDRRDVWVFPVPLSTLAIGFKMPDPDEIPMATYPVAVYRLALDPDLHRASINDAGRYRYEFQRYENR